MSTAAPSTAERVASSSVVTNQALPGAHHLALGGGGIGSLIIHLFIWHEIFRLFRYLWHIHTYGPFIVVLLGVIIVGLLVWRRSGKPLPFGRRRSGSSGYGTGTGPRDW